MFTKHYRMLMILLLAGIIISIPLSMLFGSASLDFNKVIGVMLYKLNPNRFILESRNYETIVWNLRLPRILLAIACGIGLTMGGVTMQAMTRNVMAEPYTLGVASGAAAFAALYLSRIEGEIAFPLGVNAFAFLGAIVSMLLIITLSAGKRYASNFKLVLSGIVIGLVFNAAKDFIVSTTVNPNKVNNIVLWSLGGFGAARWDNILIPIVVSLLCFVIIYFMGEKLNLLSVGDQTAITLGISLKSFQRVLVLITSVLTGTIVASCGIISFVGLIVPHIVRKLVGSDHKKLIPVSGLFGALMLIWTDVLARTIIAPEELSITVLTSLIGGPFLVFLLFKEKGA